MPGKALFLMATGPPSADRSATEAAVAATLETWRAIAAALSPVIGMRGFTALYHRSVRRVAAQFDWLEAAADVRDDADAFAPLRSVLVQRTAEEVGAASDALRDVFRDLLDHLIGAALAQRLVGARLQKPETGTHGNPANRR